MSFTAEVLDGGGGGHAVLVPPAELVGFSAGRPRVLARVNGVEYHSRLARYGGRTYLGLRKALLQQIGAATGDTVEIELTEEAEPPEPDPGPVAPPAELDAALAADPQARAAWDALPPSHRREYTRWVAEAVRPETRNQRADRTVRRLTPPTS